MGAVARRFAKHVIVTSDNPRSEDPQSIIDEVVAGILDHSSVFVEADRYKAIEKALRDMQQEIKRY